MVAIAGVGLVAELPRGSTSGEAAGGARRRTAKEWEGGCLGPPRALSYPCDSRRPTPRPSDSAGPRGAGREGIFRGARGPPAPVLLQKPEATGQHGPRPERRPERPVGSGIGGTFP
jgi:hypothetical protein